MTSPADRTLLCLTWPCLVLPGLVLPCLALSCVDAFLPFGPNAPSVFSSLATSLPLASLSADLRGFLSLKLAQIHGDREKYRSQKGGMRSRFASTEYYIANRMERDLMLRFESDVCWLCLSQLVSSSISPEEGVKRPLLPKERWTSQDLTKQGIPTERRWDELWPFYIEKQCIPPPSHDHRKVIKQKTLSMWHRFLARRSRDVRIA